MRRHKKLFHMENPQLIMLGTGNAVVTRCYNTCFILKDRGSMLLVDAGGGNGILQQLEKAGIRLGDAVWVTRVIMQEILKGKYSGVFNIYGHDKSIKVLSDICRMTLHKKYSECIGKTVLMNEVHNGERFQAGAFPMECFDVKSTKEKQFGFRTALSDGEPFNGQNISYVENADWLMCEAFCLYGDREVFKPYEKNHSTALDTGIIAEQLHVRNLVLYHTEDTCLLERKKRYGDEAGRNFSGTVHVPDDLETIPLHGHLGK